MNGKHKRILLQVFTFTLVLVIIGALYIPCSLSDFYDQSHIQFIHQSIERIPMEDRADLKRVLEKGIFRSQFGYTLFGEKPLSIDGYLEERAIHASYKRRNNPKMKKDAIERNHKLQKGWKIWEKYAHFFPSENYILRKQPDSVMDGAVTIYLMNKKAFYQVIEKYRQDFEKVLGKDFCVEEIINSFEKGEGIFFDKIVEHDGLFGTLLGYGRDNAWDFYRKTEIAKRLTMQEEISSEEKNNLTQELQFLKEKLVLFNTEWIYFPKFMFMPFFMANPETQETKELKKRYEKNRKKMESIYRSGNFFEVTLLQFTKKT